ncbi:MAG TPA: hypothetical protein DCW31_05910 [Lactobacillus sp.]|nr:hypothetical protein [Lactobacillus sp.]
MDSEPQNNRMDRHQSNHRARNIVLIVLAVVVLSICGYGYHVFSSVERSTSKMYSASGLKKSRNVSQLIKEQKPISILLLGTDVGALGRNSKVWAGGRTDSMMLVTINPKTKTTTMMSIPRDSLAVISGHENQFPTKINAAYYFGQTKSTIATVQNMFNVPVDYYGLLNMGGMEKLVNEVGGVDIVPPLTFTYEKQHFTKGKEIHVNGSQALKFTRMRYQDPESDYGRTLRQRIVIQALLKKGGKLNNLLNAQFVDSLASQSRTDLSLSDLMELAKSYRTATKHVISDHAQGVSDDIAGQSFEILPQTEKQRVTNELRKQLDMSAEKTGPRFGEAVPAGMEAYVPAADFGDTADTQSTWGHDTNTSSQYNKAYDRDNTGDLNPNYDANN